jgi:hypothetical protein
MKMSEEKTQFTNKVYYLGSRRGYWSAVLDIVSGMEQQLEYAKGKPELSKIKIATNNILLYSTVLDRAQDKYNGEKLFDDISVEKRLEILSNICSKEIDFSNEELRDEYMD